jgi:hypothetical protein
MLSMLGGNEATVEAINAAVGRRIESCALVDNRLRLTLEGGQTLVLHDAGQSCCEARYMDTDVDMSWMAGSKLLALELRDAPNIASEDGYEEREVQFLEVRTSSGVLSVANHVDHNGYYGGFAIVASLEPSA